MTRTFLPIFLACGVSACGAAAPASPAAAPAPSPRAAPQELPPLTADEQLLIEMLERHLSYLTTKVGERNENASWELADAADYIATQIEGWGLTVERQGYETRNVAAQNLAVTIPGSERGDQIFVVGAHYDSPAGDSGANAGGSATAALLTLVELMKGANLKRTLRFVFFSMGESPHGDGEARGARQYARYLVDSKGRETTAGPEADMATTKRAETIGLLHLDRLGSFSPPPGADVPLAATLTTTPGSEVLRRLFLEDIDEDIFGISEVELSETAMAGVPTQKKPDEATGDRPEPGPETEAAVDSDLLAFYQAGIVGVSLRGTGGDPSGVKVDQLARVVMQIRRGIGRVSGERPTNDGMLTPLSDQIR